jgi:hypothetical protein
MEAIATMNEGDRAHKFQSFWYGGPLSPYESLCLKSFIDCGHAFDLYTYDPSLAVPAGVRVRDASELIDRSEVFVYQAEGFGKGSPSAFSNLFRSKLMVEKGGWWSDTDVVCLTDRIPAVTEFFARQDADLVAWGIMYFEPRHPVMRQCLDQAKKLGRTVKWGDSGPVLLTRVLKECGLIDRARPASICYPIHYDQALDVLRPSQTAALASKIESSLFLHLWNAMLVFRGVQKTCLPPNGSLLRRYVDKHPVDGWAGEYDEQTLEHALGLKAELNELAQQLRAEIGMHGEESARLQGELEAMQASTSWRLTAPLRAGRRHLRALRALGKRR